MPSEWTVQRLSEAVSGNMESFEFLREQRHEDILQSMEGLGRLVVTRESVCGVLEALLLGRITPEQAQSWGSFIMHRFVSGSALGPIQTLDIEYDPIHEDEIAEAVMRLEWLGDAVDGDMSAEEIREIMRKLSCQG